ncbi:unnamed protein product, partial [Leptidea sinapis]
ATMLRSGRGKQLVALVTDNAERMSIQTAMTLIKKIGQLLRQTTIFLSIVLSFDISELAVISNIKMSGLYSLILVSRRLYSSTSHHHIKAQKYVLTKYFQGEPKKSDFKIIEEELPELKNGEILTQAEFLSVDPYMRAYMIGYKLPTDMIGGQVAKVIASRNDKFSVGSHVCGAFGWRTHTVCNPDKLNEAGLMPTVLVPDITPHPVSLALGCRVIGFAGSDDKCNYLEKELGFDRVYNYKTTDIRTALKDGAPKRVDCYFDNVGGEISTTIMSYMNKYGRVAVCGSISSYNDLKPPKVSIVQPAIVFKELKVEGFLVNRWFGRWNEGVEANRKWLNDGSLKYQEKVYNGFENMVDALNGILRGENIAADDEYLYAVCFEDTKNMDKIFKNIAESSSCNFVHEQNKTLKQFHSELTDYFNGKLKKFLTPIKTTGSEFQKEVWNKLVEQPYGSTQSYADLAKSLGRSSSHSRAIGAACGANAHLIVVPCHRIVASAHKGGFSCGIDRKEWLLNHEKKYSSTK